MIINYVYKFRLSLSVELFYVKVGGWDIEKFIIVYS